MSRKPAQHKRRGRSPHRQDVSCANRPSARGRLGSAPLRNVKGCRPRITLFKGRLSGRVLAGLGLGTGTGVGKE
jgi:hypothetical protein